MVNGDTSKIIYLGAWATVLVSIIGQVILAVFKVAAPAELQAASLAAFALISGTHIMPPQTRAVEPVGDGTHDRQVVE